MFPSLASNRDSTVAVATDVKTREPTVAIVHDYLTQRGGAERVVLSMVRAFPGASLHTSVYEPSATFSDFADVDIRTSPLQRLRPLRRNHRLALPLLAPAFSRARVNADVVLCSSSGWAHGVGTVPGARKIVYCYAPARWLHQTDRYLRKSPALTRLADPFFGPLRRWDRRSALSAHLYLTSSTHIRGLIRATYGIDAEVVPPPVTIDCDGPQEPVAGVKPGFVLTVSRLLRYKNVEAVVAAFAGLPDEQLVVVGSGPMRAEIQAAAGPNVHLVGRVDDEGLSWLYANCRAVVAAGYEDFGLTPLEAASFGRPAVVLRFGGYLDTVVDGTTGLFFDEPAPELIAEGIRRAGRAQWDPTAIAAHAASYSEERFVGRLRQVVTASSAAT